MLFCSMTVKGVYDEMAELERNMRASGEKIYNVEIRRLEFQGLVKYEALVGESGHVAFLPDSVTIRIPDRLSPVDAVSFNDLLGSLNASLYGLAGGAWRLEVANTGVSVDHRGAGVVCITDVKPTPPEEPPDEYEYEYEALPEHEDIYDGLGMTAEEHRRERAADIDDDDGPPDEPPDDDQAADSDPYDVDVDGPGF